MNENSFGEGETGRRCSFQKGVVQMKTEDVLLLLNLLAVVIFGILSLVLK